MHSTAWPIAKRVNLGIPTHRNARSAHRRALTASEVQEIAPSAPLTCFFWAPPVFKIAAKGKTRLSVVSPT